MNVKAELEKHLVGRTIKAVRTNGGHGLVVLLDLDNGMTVTFTKSDYTGDQYVAMERAHGRDTLTLQLTPGKHQGRWVNWGAENRKED